MLKILGETEAVSKEFLNAIVTKLNELDKSNNFQAYRITNNGVVTSSIEGNMAVVAVQKYFGGNATSYFSNNISVSYGASISFTSTPIVTATYLTTSATNVDVTLKAVNNSSATVSLLNTAESPTNTRATSLPAGYINLIAVGPVDAARF